MLYLQRRCRIILAFLVPITLAMFTASPAVPLAGATTSAQAQTQFSLNGITIIRLGGYDTPGTAHKVQVVGDRAYVADGSGGMQVIDVSNPVSPTLVATYSAPQCCGDVAAAGDLVYLLDVPPPMQTITGCTSSICAIQGHPLCLIRSQRPTPPPWRLRATSPIWVDTIAKQGGACYRSTMCRILVNLRCGAR